MTIEQNNMPTINVEKLHFAKLLSENTDDVTKTTYDTPKWFAGVRQIGAKPKVQATQIYGDGRMMTSLSNVSSIDVTVDVVSLNDEEEAYLLGHQIAEDGGIIYGDCDKAPTLAMIFRSPKAKGGDRYLIFYAGEFEPYDIDIKQQEGKTTPSYTKLKATFRPLSNGLYKHKFDSDSPNVSQDKIDNFFKKVYIPTPKKVVSEESH